MKRLMAAAMLIGFLSACGPITGANPSPSTSSNASPAIPAGFASTPAHGGAADTSTVTTVQVEPHQGYDRFVIVFDGGVPSYTVTPQSSATFTRSPRGDQVTLDGTSGVLIVIHSVTNWMGYMGPTAFHPAYPYLQQALQVENYEGYQQWALGIHGMACVRVRTMSSPERLVVDVVGI